jgi:hypothetical protein
MNKTSILLCSLFGAATAFAQGPVYSVNIVGIQKTQVGAGDVQMLATPFNSATNTLNGVVKEQLAAGYGGLESDFIYLWTGSGYQTFFRVADDVTDPPGLAGKWVNAVTLQPASEAITPGVAFWVQNNQSAEQTVSVVGDVENRPTVQKQINPGLQMISYPYSTSFNLYNDSSLKTSGAVMGYGITDADTIYLYLPAQRIYKTLVLAAEDVGDPALNGKWVDITDPNNPIPANFDIQSGTGFWYYHQGSSAMTWTSTKPY